MREIQAKELSCDSFSVYGTFARMLDPEAPKIGEKPVEFFRDMAQLNLGQNIASFSVCRVVKRPLVVDTTEMHRTCGEGILPLDCDVLIHLGVATPNGEVPFDGIEAFRVPRGTFVSLRRGVWHHAPYALGCDCANVLIVLAERVYADDCLVVDIPAEKRTLISQ